MQELTLYDAYMECSRLWFWKRRNPKKKKKDWPGWEKYEERYGNLETINHCPCCDYRVRNEKVFDCKDCLPGLWSETIDNDSPCFNDPFSPYYGYKRTQPESCLKIARFARNAARRIKK